MGKIFRIDLLDIAEEIEYHLDFIQQEVEAWKKAYLDDEENREYVYRVFEQLLKETKEFRKKAIEIMSQLIIMR